LALPKSQSGGSEGFQTIDWLSWRAGSKSELSGNLSVHSEGKRPAAASDGRVEEYTQEHVVETRQTENLATRIHWLKSPMPKQCVKDRGLEMKN
jgi:hypothetical protein